MSDTIETTDSTPAAELPLGSGIDPDVNVNIPAPLLCGAIFHEGMNQPVQIIAMIERNELAHVSLMMPSSGARLAACTIRFRRPEDGVSPGEWFLAAINEAGHNLYTDWLKEARKPRILKPDGKLVGADGKALTK